MRQSKTGGNCIVCGDTSRDGIFWHTIAKVLDFGVPGIPPIEPDMTEPERCDACEGLVLELERRESLGNIRRATENLRRGIKGKNRDKDIGDE